MADRDRPVWLVARREILDATRTTSFRVTLLISALALAAIIVIANIGSDEPETDQVVVAGDDDAGAARIAAIEALGAATGLRIEVAAAADDDAARAAVEGGDADVAVSADGTRLTTQRPVDLAGDSDTAVLVNVLRAELALDAGLQAAGLSPDQVSAVRATEPPEVDSVRGEDPDEVDPSRVAAAMVINILLFVMLQTYGQWVLTGVTREKASRVVEVLLSVITPRQLLVGKVLGIGLVALGHAAVLAVTAFVTTRVMGVDLTSGIAPGDLALAAVWFVLGYALYCGVYAAAGSLVSRVEDAQTAAFPVILPLLLGYIVAFSAAGGANTLLWVLAFIPPTAVIAMPTLYAIGEASIWMVFVSMALTVAATLLVGVIAAKIYERSVLHSGKKLGWKEALRRPSEFDRTVTPSLSATVD